MEIHEQQVKGAGGRIRRIGEDARAYLDAVSAPMTACTQANAGFTAVTTLKQIGERLHRAAAGLADQSRATGDKIVIAAGNHQTADAGQARVFAALNPGRAGA